MAGLYGISPITVSVVGQVGQAVEMRPGQAYSGTVQGAGNQMFVQVGNQNMPIEPVAGLQPGQHVDVELVQGRGGPQLKITPHAARGQAAPPPPAQGGIWSVLTAALESLNALDQAEFARQLPPAFMPPRQGALEQLLLLFLNRGSVGSDLERVSAQVQQAVNAGAVSNANAQAFLGLASALLATSSDDIRASLQRLVQMAGQSMEARLASAISSGRIDRLLKTLHEDLKAELARLRNDANMVRYLRGQGLFNEFQQLTDRVVDRFAAVQLQNLRAFELPYFFLEVPFTPGAAIRHAQIHFFGEGQGPRSHFDAKNATIVMDLATSRMGDLWISLSILRGHCVCWIRVTEIDVLENMEAQAHELRDQLAKSGYPGSEVHVTLWDGNRLKEAAGLMRRFSRLNLQA